MRADRPRAADRTTYEVTTYNPSSPNLPETTPSVKPTTVPPPDMSVRASSRCAHRGPRIPPGMLHPKSPDVAARLRDEGVPPQDIREVAMDLWRILPLMNTRGVELAYVRVHPWVAQLVERYGDKITSVFMPARKGGRTAR